MFTDPIAEEIAAIQKRIDVANKLNKNLVQATQSMDAVSKEAESELIEALWPLMQDEVCYLRDLLNLNGHVGISLKSRVAFEPWVTVCWYNSNNDLRPRGAMFDVLFKAKKFHCGSTFQIPDPSRKLNMFWEWGWGHPWYFKKFGVRADIQHTPHLLDWLSDHDLNVNWGSVVCGDSFKTFRELELEAVEENRKSRHKLGFFNLVRGSQQKTVK